MHTWEQLSVFTVGLVPCYYQPFPAHISAFKVKNNQGFNEKTSLQAHLNIHIILTSLIKLLCFYTVCVEIRNLYHKLFALFGGSKWRLESHGSINIWILNEG